MFTPGIGGAAEPVAPEGVDASPVKENAFVAELSGASNGPVGPELENVASQLVGVRTEVGLSVAGPVIATVAVLVELGVGDGSSTVTSTEPPAETSPGVADGDGFRVTPGAAEALGSPAASGTNGLNVAASTNTVSVNAKNERSVPEPAVGVRKCFTAPDRAGHQETRHQVSHRFNRRARPSPGLAAALRGT